MKAVQLSESITSKLRTSIQNTVAAKGKTPQQQSSKHENRDASPTIDLLQRSFESLQHALNNKELELMSPSHGGQDHRYLVQDILIRV